MEIHITAMNGGNEAGVATLTGAFTIYQAADAKPRLLGALESFREVEIDLMAVDEIDTAGVQLLVLVKREAQRQGRDLRLVHGGASLDAVERYNLGSYFGDPVVFPSSAAGR